MKRLLLFLLIFSCALPLTGCENSLDLSLMVVSMGVDVHAQGVTVTIKAPDYSAAAQSGGGDEGSSQSGGAQGYLTISVTGTDWAHAMMLLSASTPRKLHFTQLREVAVGLDSLQRIPLPELLAYIDRIQSVRSHAVLVMCPGKAQEFIARQQPYIGKRLSKHLDATLQVYAQNGYIPTTSLSAALRDYMGYWRDPLVAYASVNIQKEAGQPQNGQPVDELGGDLPREGLDTAEYVGAFAMGAYGAYTLLTGYEMQLYNLITGHDQLLLFGYDGRYYGAERVRPVQLRIEENAQSLTLVLDLSVNILYSIYSGPPERGVTAYLEGEISALLHKLQSVSCDALGYGSVAVRAFADLHSWNAWQWPARYRQASVIVRIDASMQQSGRV